MSKNRTSNRDKKAARDKKNSEMAKRKMDEPTGKSKYARKVANR